MSQIKIFKGKWEDFFEIDLPIKIINVKINYKWEYLKLIENFLGVPLSYLYIFVDKQINEFIMKITLDMNNSELISQLKESKDINNYGKLEKLYSLLLSKVPNLEIHLSFSRINNENFDFNKNKVDLYINGDEERIISYFKEVIKLYFEEFIKDTFKKIVCWTNCEYPISEKEFIDKDSYIIEEINKKATSKVK